MPHRNASCTAPKARRPSLQLLASPPRRAGDPLIDALLVARDTDLACVNSLGSAVRHARSPSARGTMVRHLEQTRRHAAIAESLLASLGEVAAEPGTPNRRLDSLIERLTTTLDRSLRGGMPSDMAAAVVVVFSLASSYYAWRSVREVASRSVEPVPGLLEAARLAEGRSAALLRVAESWFSTTQFAPEATWPLRLVHG